MIKYIIAFITMLFVQNINAADVCYDRIPALAYENGPNMVYFCPSGWTHILPENECRTATKCPDVVENVPDCVEGYEKVYNNVDGSLYGCMIPCPSGQIRDHWSDGDPMNSCRIDCPSDMGLEIYDDQCRPLECFNPATELVILPSKPYRTCLYKCSIGQERNFDKYNDYNCHKKTCPLGEHFEGDVCVKDPEPEPDTCTTTIVGAVNCLKENVLDSLQNLDKTSLFNQIIDILTFTSESLDSDNSNNPDGPDNPNQPPLEQSPDTSEFDSDLPINQLEERFLDKNLFQYSARCPADRSFSLWTFSYSFSYQRICEALDKLSYLVLAIAFALSAYIIVRQ